MTSPPIWRENGLRESCGIQSVLTVAEGIGQLSLIGEEALTRVESLKASGIWIREMLLHVSTACKVTYGLIATVSEQLRMTLLKYRWLAVTQLS